MVFIEAGQLMEVENFAWGIDFPGPRHTLWDLHFSQTVSILTRSLSLHSEMVQVRLRSGS